MSMRVQGQKATESGVVQVRTTEARSTEAVENSAFRRTLTDMSKEMYTARITEMKKEIDEQGKLLADRVDVKDLEKYRRLIREFLDEIVSNGYTFSREDAYASRGKHRYIATVQIIDEKLDALGKEVISEHADKIEILNKIDDIRGLLLDLMM
ncbi:MAG: YaaR family protein [Oscillospiraceae bacterium]|nr:YaaR family protein [Oscillospiraceae bacterium]